MCETSLGKEGSKEGAQGGEEVSLHLHLATVHGQQSAVGWLKGDCFQVAENKWVGCGHCEDQAITVSVQPCSVWWIKKVRV